MSTESTNGRNQMIGGVLLLGLGGLFLTAQSLGDTTSGLLIVPAVGALLLLWGILTHHAGPLIPGGIVTGVGIGLLLSAGGSEGAAFMLSLGVGFMLVTVTTALFTPTTHWWALLPGGINMIIGLGFVFGDAAWQVLNWWPLILVGVGVYILIKNRSRSRRTSEEVS